jgi:hypothetical protein
MYLWNYRLVSFWEFKSTHSSHSYDAERTRLRKKWIKKLSIGADVLKQIICTIKIRRAPTRHDNIDFKSIITRTSEIKPLSIAVADKVMTVRRIMF